ncbi:MAG: hypothetical protein RQ754_05270 [Desulfuromonadales bacterium]|nr:hypothetical protein [Desulfuromonadales bacterium]
MGKCLKGESGVKKEDARFQCSKCGAAATKKDHMCKAEGLKGREAVAEEKKKKKKQ